MKQTSTSYAGSAIPTIAPPTAPLSPQGDQDHYAEAYETGFFKTLRLIRFRGATYELAEEVAQAAWARGWQYRHQLHDASAVVSWVNTIAMNLYRSASRLEDRLVELKEHAGPYTGLKSLDLVGVLNACSMREMRMITLFYFEGYSNFEIAKMENICPTTARVRLMRIRRKLREKFNHAKVAA